MMIDKWLSIVGIGEDGLDGVSTLGRELIVQAKIIIGGQRHLEMLPPDDSQVRQPWTFPIAESVQQILSLRGQRVCILATGDPMCYGVGVTLTRHIPITEITIIPAPSAFSLACSRLGWSLTAIETLSLCGRDLALLRAFLYPRARLLVLSADKKTPSLVAQLLTEQGLGASEITVLERLGGVHERLVTGKAASWHHPDLADLNTIAISCITDTPLETYFSPRVFGLPDSAYHHDGQLTKREIRTITLSTLAPLPGQLLWDVGAGCGSIGIEWMRSSPRCLTFAIEQDTKRCQYITDNALALGIPGLKIIQGKAPEVLQDLPQPDAIFLGGGLTTPLLFETCWQALPLGGRLVANAVTVEGEQKLFAWHRQWGGELIRLACQRAEPVGKFLGWKARANITQWVSIKGFHQG